MNSPIGFHIPLVSISVVLMVGGCAGEPPPEAFESATESLEHLIKVANVDTDAEFKKQLVDDGQRKEHLAPEGLRKLLRGEEIVRWILTQGVVHENDRLSLYWRIGGCGLLGEANDVQKRLFDRLDTMGFTSFPSPEERYAFGFRRKRNGIEETVLLKKPNPWDGGRRQVAGMAFSWTVRSTSTSPLPTYKEVTKAMPIFHDDRIADNLYELFKDERLTRVENGGTWTKYYSLRVDIPNFPQEGEDDDSLYKHLVNQITKMGFEQGKRPRFSTWDIFRPADRTKHAPVIQIKTPEDKSAVFLSIQPET